MNKFAPLKYTSEQQGTHIEIELPFVVGIMADLNRSAVQSKVPFKDRQFIAVDSNKTKEFFDVVKPSIIVNLTNLGFQILILFRSFEDIQPARLEQNIEHELIEYDALNLSKTEMHNALNEILQNEGLHQLLGSLRGIYQLLKNKPNESNLVIKVLDVSKEELINEINLGVTQESYLYRLVYLQEYGAFRGTPYSLVLTDFEFSQNDTDMKVMEYLALLGVKADCVFFLKAASTIFGDSFQHECSGWTKIDTNFSSAEFLRWRALRDHESSRFIAMVAALRHESTVNHHDIVNPVFAAALNLIPCFTGTDLWNFTNNNNVPFSETESINKQSIKALGRLGFNTVKPNTHTLLTPVSGIVALHAPRKYFEQSANEIANVMVSVPYNLFATAFVRYITIIIRETLGQNLDIDTLTRMVNQWLKFYIDDRVNQKHTSIDLLKPLSRASVSIEEVAGVPGVYKGRLKIQLRIEEFEHLPCTQHEFNVLSIY